MIIKASSKDYEVTVNNNFDVIEKLQIDKDTYVVIDKKQTSTDLTAVLMKPDMSLLVVHDVKTSEIKTAITYLFDNLRRK